MNGKMLNIKVVQKSNYKYSIPVVEGTTISCCSISKSQFSFKMIFGRFHLFDVCAKKTVNLGNSLTDHSCRIHSSP